MKLLREKKKRWLWSMLASMLICTMLSVGTGQKGMLAWWGVLYPDFCMVEAKKWGDKVNEEENKKQSEGGVWFYTKDGVKLSFWFAKVLGW